MAGDGNSYIRVKWNLGRSYFVDYGPPSHTAYAGLRNWVKFVSHTTEPASLVYRFIGLHR
jgi:hypothetical protein